MGKPKITFISNAQFGYHSDPFYFAKNLSKYYDVSFICQDRGFKKVYSENIYVKYIKNTIPNKLFQYLYIFYIFPYVRKNTNSLYLVFLFPNCFLLPLFSKKRKFIYDIRSGGVSKNKYRNYKKNFIIKWNSLFYENITIISTSLADLLKLSSRKAHILPLGGQVIPQKIKEINKLDLLYVGTFSNRNLEYTIQGFAKFYAKYAKKIEMSYSIIGFGKNSDIDILKNTIKHYKLEDVVKLIGRKTQEELIPFFQNNNVGISFVPITKYYDVQPPTKTFEYLLSGMVVLATSTLENSKLINDKNGVLIEDNTESFYEGLKKIYQNLKKFNFLEIYENSQQYSWENIVKKNLKPYLLEKISETK